MILRPAEADDALDVAGVHVRSWQAAYRGLLPDAYLNGLRPEERAARYTFGHADPSSPWTLVALVDDAICGFATTAPCQDPDLPGYGELCALYVDPAKWGAGVGRALIAAARGQLERSGFASASLWVLAGNERAERFYRADGWVADGSERQAEVWGVEVDERRYRRSMAPGYHSLTPRMVVDDVQQQVAFMRSVFGATGDVRPDGPAELRIGDSLVMISQSGERDPFPAFLYVYVDDADAVYRRAMEAGAESLEAPLDTPYGDRRAMVRDQAGNIFQIAHPNSRGKG